MKTYLVCFKEPIWHHYQAYIVASSPEHAKRMAIEHGMPSREIEWQQVMMDSCDEFILTPDHVDVLSGDLAELKALFGNQEK